MWTFEQFFEAARTVPSPKGISIKFENKASFAKKTIRRVTFKNKSKLVKAGKHWSQRLRKRIGKTQKPLWEITNISTEDN